MGAEPQREWTAEEYLAYERASEVKHEYSDGELFAMSGASRAHGRIAWNLGGALYPQLEQASCEGFTAEMRVRIPGSDRYTYPDLVVVCGEPEFEDAELDTLVNPTLVVEILSPSTEDYDRGRKLFHYRSIPSLQAVLLVSQEEVHVELYERQPDGRWVLSEADDADQSVDLPAIGARLALADVYRRVI